MKPNEAPAQIEATAAWAALHHAACAPYRKVSRWAWHWARGKLAGDPVFRGLLERGDLPAHARVLDIGCGQGLLASLMRSCAEQRRAGAWPAAWPVPASASAYTGIELMPKDVARAEAALGGGNHSSWVPRFLCADMRHAALPACDLVVILDVLHYVDHAAQLELLQRVRDALRAPGQPPGRLLLRVGDAASRLGFAISQGVDRLATVARGHRVAPTWGRPLEDWMQLLQGLGFVVHSVPQSQGTPFANVLLVADLRADPFAGAYT